MLDVLNTTLHVRDSGDTNKHAIVLIHGLGAHLQTWDEWAPVLSAQYRVVRFDLPGAGLSPLDPHENYTDRRSIQLIAAMLDKLGIDRAVLAGHSLGGRIAWRFAAASPDRVSHLVLLSPDGFASPGFDYGKAPQVPFWLKIMRYMLPKILIRLYLNQAYANPSNLTDATVERYHELLRAPGSRRALLQR